MIGPAHWPAGWQEADHESRLPWIAFPGEVLSYPPNETLPPVATHQLEELDDILRSSATKDPQGRDVAAVARLVIGPGHGLHRREAVWDGKCQAKAGKMMCDYEQWWNASLLGVWPEVAGFLATRAMPVATDFQPATHKLVAPYEAFEHAIREMPPPTIG